MQECTEVIGSLAMKFKFYFILPAVILSSVLHAEIVSTGKGKVLSTQGHWSPSCRTIRFQESGSSMIQIFRIQNVQGDDINAVILSSMMADKDVVISYDPNITSGCGTEPRISHVTVFK